MTSLKLLLSILLISGTSFQDPKASKFLPKALRKVEFGMTINEVKKIRPGLVHSGEDEAFREVYIEEVNKDGINAIIYYFDADDSKGLYEFIVNYDAENERDKVTQKLLKTPNYKEVEWKIKVQGNYPLHAWTYQKKLIYVMPLPGTEWEDGLIP